MILSSILLLQIVCTNVTGACYQTGYEPLTIDEGRLILGQLYELKTSRAEIEALYELIRQDQEVDRQVSEYMRREIENERAMNENTAKERDLEHDKAETYRILYESLMKKPGWGCKIKKILTLGLADC